MIRSFPLDGQRFRGLTVIPPHADGPVWFDLLDPTDEEMQALATHLGIALPSRADMAEIEATSRLYSEDGADFMTALVPSGADQGRLRPDPVTFVLAQGHLVSIRYHDPRPFASFVQRAERAAQGLHDGGAVLLELLDTIIDRQADILERAARDIDALSRTIFTPDDHSDAIGSGFKTTLQRIGQSGELISGIRDCLVTLDRLVVYLGPRQPSADPDRQGKLKALSKDVKSLQDQSEFMSQKVTFLLDATLGLINIEQAGIIKIFSVVSVVFLPPTLVASIYGMNFRLMPELDWSFGYPLAIGVMILSAILPFAYFKYRRWL